MNPHELRRRSQWLLWRYELQKGDKKPRKMPYYVNGKRRHGHQGSDGDRLQLVLYEVAFEARSRGKYDGVGFAFLPGDGLIGIDLDNVIDLQTGEISDRAQSIIDACASYTEYSPSKKGVHIFVAGSIEGSFKSNEIGVEVFCGGQFFTFTGEHYPGTPETVNAAAETVLRRLRATVNEAKGRRHVKPAARQVAEQLVGRAKVESALAVVSAECGYNDWIAVGMAIHAELGAAGIDVWDYWSSKSAKYPGRRVLETHWTSFESAGGITGATLFKMARDSGWRPPGRPKAAAPAAQSAAPDVKEALPAGYSEDRIACEFTGKYGADWRYVAIWGKWLYWDGRLWKIDETLKHFDLARKICRAVAVRVRADSEVKNRERIASLIGSARTVAAVVKLAAADRVHAADLDEFDCNQMVLNTPAGLVDLRTGQLRPHDRGANCTKITRASPRGRCPMFFCFLWRVTGGDRRLVMYLQRWFGYVLTALTIEHALAFFYGTGANGKSTLLNCLLWLLGDYAQVAASDLLIDSNQERHPTDLAVLRAARLVVAQETPEGRRFAESRVKSCTGGDPITARLMRQDPFTFVPAFKLLLSGNHKPTLRSVDEAMRRRLHLVPFAVQIPVEERDQHLAEKLRAEADGILAWCVRGCLRWQRLGLRLAPIVSHATRDYFIDEDMLDNWLRECLEIEPEAFTGSSALHHSYRQWAERSGEKFYGLKRIIQQLEDRGFRRERTRDANGFRGLKIRA